MDHWVGGALGLLVATSRTASGWDWMGKGGAKREHRLEGGRRVGGAEESWAGRRGPALAQAHQRCTTFRPAFATFLVQH